MRITYTGSGLFEIDGDTLSPGETTDVSEERGELLLKRFPEDLCGETAKPKATGKTATSPIAQSTPADTAPSDSTGVSD